MKKIFIIMTMSVFFVSCSSDRNVRTFLDSDHEEGFISEDDQSEEEFENNDSDIIQNNSDEEQGADDENIDTSKSVCVPPDICVPVEFTKFPEKEGKLESFKIENNHLILEFSDKYPEFKTGDVLVGQKNGGFLKKVTGDSYFEDGRLVVPSEDAQYREAFSYTHMPEKTYHATLDNINTAVLEKLRTGGQIESTGSDYSLRSAFSSSNIGSGSINGHYFDLIFEFNDVEIEIKFANGTVATFGINKLRVGKNIGIIFSLDQTLFNTDLTFVKIEDEGYELNGLKIEGKADVLSKLPVSKIMLLDIPALAAIPVGHIVITLGCGISIGASLNTGLKLTSDLVVSALTQTKTGGIYKEGKWSVVNERKVSADGTVNNISNNGPLSGILEGAIFVEGMMDVSLYTIFGPEFFIKVSPVKAKLELMSDMSVNYSLKADVQSGARLALTLFNIPVFEVSAQVAELEYLQGVWSGEEKCNTCESVSAECGQIPDNCGSYIFCGVCDKPENPVCITSYSYRTYDSNGTCTESGKCEYNYVTTECSGSTSHCFNASCVECLSDLHCLDDETCSGNVCKEKTVYCEENAYKKCYGNDVWWYNSCDVKGIKAEECGNDELGGERVCMSGDVYDTKITRGCDQNVCFEDSETVKLFDCDLGCENGTCVLPVECNSNYCQDNGFSGGSYCEQTSTLVTCGKDSNGCGIVSKTTTCTSTQICSESTCQSCGRVNSTKSDPCCSGDVCNSGLKCNSGKCKADSTKVSISSISFGSGDSSGSYCTIPANATIYHSGGFSATVLICVLDSSGNVQSARDKSISSNYSLTEYKTCSLGMSCKDAEAEILIIVGSGFSTNRTEECRKFLNGTMNQDNIFASKRAAYSTCKSKCSICN